MEPVDRLTARIQTGQAGEDRRQVADLVEPERRDRVRDTGRSRRDDGRACTVGERARLEGRDIGAERAGCFVDVDATIPPGVAGEAFAFEQAHEPAALDRARPTGGLHVQVETVGEISGGFRREIQMQHMPPRDRISFGRMEIRILDTVQHPSTRENRRRESCRRPVVRGCGEGDVEECLRMHVDDGVLVLDGETDCRHQGAVAADDDGLVHAEWRRVPLVRLGLAEQAFDVLVGLAARAGERRIRPVPRVGGALAGLVFDALDEHADTGRAGVSAGEGEHVAQRVDGRLHEGDAAGRARWDGVDDSEESVVADGFAEILQERVLAEILGQPRVSLGVARMVFGQAVGGECERDASVRRLIRFDGRVSCPVFAGDRPAWCGRVPGDGDVAVRARISESGEQLADPLHKVAPRLDVCRVRERVDAEPVWHELDVMLARPQGQAACLACARQPLVWCAGLVGARIPAVKLGHAVVAGEFYAGAAP